MVIAAIGFGTLVYGLSEIGVVGDRGTAYAALAVGVVGVVGFVLRQLVLQREDKPLLDLRTLKLPVFAISLGAMSVAFMAMLGSMILLPLYLQNVRGMSAFATGMLVMPGGLAMGLLGPRVGRVYDAFGARVLVIPGAIGLLGAMTPARVRVGATTPTWQILAAHVVLMVSLAALFTPLFTMGLGVLPPHLYSHGSSLLGTLQQVAGAVGTALVVMIMSSRAAAQVRDGVGPVAAQLDGMRWAFGVSALLCVVVLALVTLLPARVPGGMTTRLPRDSTSSTSWTSSMTWTRASRSAPTRSGEVGYCDFQPSAPTSSIRSWVRAVSRILARDSGRAFTIVSVAPTMSVTIRFGEHPQVLGGPPGRVGQPGEVGGQLTLDELDLVADGPAHGRRAGDALPRDEREVRVLGGACAPRAPARSCR